MIFKKDVRLTGIKVELLLAMGIADDLHVEQLGSQVFITSVRDGKHSRNSKHYLGYAFDVRSRNMTEEEDYRFTETLAARLGPEYYVESEDDHIHIQFNGGQL